MPASALESLVLPARIDDTVGPLLDDLMATGRVLWAGHGSLPGDDAWISLHLADGAETTLPAADTTDLTDVETRVLAALSGGGAYFFRDLSDAVARDRVEGRDPVDDDALADVLWSLAHRGLVTGDTLAPVRGLLAGGRTAHKPQRRPAARGRYGGRPRLGRASLPQRSGPPRAAGRWSVLPTAETDPTLRLHATAEGLLDRHGVVTRGAVVAEEVQGRVRRRPPGARRRRGSRSGATRVLHRGSGRLAVRRPRRSRRGALVPRARGCRGPGGHGPGQPVGAALRWPERDSGHQPGRKAGALVVAVDGQLVLYVERGGRTLLSWDSDEDSLSPAARGLADAVHRGALGRLTVQRADGAPVLGSDDPLARALTGAGFTMTPRGLRLRPGGRG
ncbi:Lhr family ATP-dependent helicase [Janibacter limosus]|uniref:Lhr family ATP-dependent helicase n=1 Tax=Janibacter limosus TaxID=53458 RepID=UPI00406A8F77